MLHLLAKSFVSHHHPEKDCSVKHPLVEMKMPTTAVAPYSPLGASASFPIALLPNEILYMVFEQLTHRDQQRDIARLRLVSKRFAEIGNYYLLSEAHLFFKSSQFERLRQISEHPTISKRIDTLFYEADIQEDFGSFQNWKANICVPGWMRNVSPDNLEPPLLTDSERDHRAFNRHLQKSRHGPKYTHSDTLLRSPYDKYTEYLADQKSLRLQDYNVEMLKDALMKMPRLKTIQMSMECCISGGRSRAMDQAFKDGLTSPYGDRQTEEGCGVGPLRALLVAANAAGLKFETLAAGHLDWRFFKESSKQTLDVLRKTQGAVHSLRTLKLYISTYSEGYFDPQFDYNSHFMLEECATYVSSTSHLKDFVTAAPDLERLDINFDYNKRYPPATLCDIVGTFKWHALRVAAFALISADEDCLAQFFERHAGTLRKLRLESVLLTTGTWPTLLRSTRRVLKLEHACLTGKLKSLDPPETFDFDLSAGLNGGKRAKIEVVVEKYLRSSADGPLINLHKLIDKYEGRYVHPEADLSYIVDMDSDEAIMDRFD